MDIGWLSWTRTNNIISDDGLTVRCDTIPRMSQNKCWFLSIATSKLWIEFVRRAILAARKIAADFFCSIDELRSTFVRRLSSRLGYPIAVYQRYLRAQCTEQSVIYRQSSCLCIGDSKITPQGHVCCYLTLVASIIKIHHSNHMFRRDLTDSSEIFHC